MQVALLFWILFSLCAAQKQKPKKLLVFRPRSRHTADLHPLDSFDVPQIEFLNLLGAAPDTRFQEAGSVPNAQISRPENAFRTHPYFAHTFSKDMFMVIHDDNLSVRVDIEENLELVSKGILLYGIYDILYESLTPCCIQSEVPDVLDTNSISLSVVDAPYITKTERSLYISKLFPFPSPSEADVKCPDEAFHVFTTSVNGSFIFCRQLRVGMSISRTSTGSIRSLPDPLAKRRPTQGILSKFALHKQFFRTRTAMEPELAFLMASFALTEGCKTVLDPFCGSCSLLLAASIQGFEEAFGIEVSSAALDTKGIYKNYARAGDLKLTLENRNAEYALESNRTFDAIVSDLPYGMKEVFVSDNYDSAESLLLDIARNRLNPGGRLVYFSAKEISRKHIGSGDLKVLHCLKQDMSVTFSRYLMVIEKKKK